MIITGIQYRDIYPQTGVSWSVSVSPVQTSGLCQFLFSGDTSRCPIFDLYNGKILSPDKRLLGSYSSGDNLLFSGNLSTGASDLYLNSNALYLGLNINNTNNLFTRVALYNSGRSSIDFNNLSIYGSRFPNYSYVSSNNFTLGQTSLPIGIVNSGAYPIAIYSGSTSNTSFTITGGNPFVNIGSLSTGYIYASSTDGTDLSSTTQEIPITLYTNIGSISIPINIATATGNLGSPLIAIGPQLNAIYSQSYNDYTLLYQNPLVASAGISLSFVSGYTGLVFKPTEITSFYSASITGLVSGVGFSTFVSNLATGTGIPRYAVQQYNDLLGVFEKTTASGFLYNETVFAPDQVISKVLNVFGTGLVDIVSGQQCILAGAGTAYNKIGSGYIHYITGGQLVGMVPMGTRMSAVYFDRSFTGYLTGGAVTGRIDYIPNNKLKLNAALSPSQYYLEYISLPGTGYISTDPTGTCQIFSTVPSTGYYYDPATTGLYFYKYLSGIRTGDQGYVEDNLTGSVYAVDHSTISAYDSTIYATSFLYQNVDLNFTGNMVSEPKQTINGVLAYGYIPWTVSDTTTDGYYNATGLATGTPKLPLYAINADGNIYNLTGSGQYNLYTDPVNIFQGSYDEQVASTGIVTFTVTGQLTGTLYAYQGVKEFTGTWNIYTGNQSQLSAVPVAYNKKSYTGQIPRDIGLDFPEAIAMRVNYTDLFALGNMSIYGDTAHLRISGSSFLGIGSASGISLDIDSVRNTPDVSNNSLNCPPGYQWNNCWNYCVQCTNYGFGNKWDIINCRCP